MSQSQESPFTDLLNSNEEIEGLLQRKKRIEMESFTLINGFGDPAEVLREQVADYNRRREPQDHLHLHEVRDRGGGCVVGDLSKACRWYMVAAVVLCCLLRA